MNEEISCGEKVAPVRCVSHNCHMYSGLSSNFEQDEVLTRNCDGESEKFERFSSFPQQGEIKMFGQHLDSVHAMMNDHSPVSHLKLL